MMGPDSTFTFGKYRGLSVAAIARFDPRYLSWANENLDSVSFNDDAKAIIRPALRIEREQSMQRQNAWAWGFGQQARSAGERWRHNAIKIEHQERFNAGQEPCRCFPNNWSSCSYCGGTGWVASVGTHPEGQDGEAGLVRSMGDAVGEAETPNPSPITPNGA